MNTRSTITLLSIAALSLATAGGPAAAKRDEDRTCTTAAQAQWKPIAEVAAAVTKLGYEIDKSESKRSCYEFHARKEGAQYELYADPATGEIVRTKSR